MHDPLSTSVRRESGCPVHFLWDGAGRGRTLVHAGFLGLLLAGALAALRVPSPWLTVAWTLALLVWGAGQAVSQFDKWRVRHLRRRAVGRSLPAAGGRGPG